ncbi:MAG: 30S ribosomal protein S20 [bacterium]|nr:30S ribosomal protein S20 [bacterium]
MRTYDIGTMPNTKTAKKALRQSLKRKARNLVKRRQVKAVSKGYNRLVAGADLEGAKEQLKAAYKTLDKAAKTKVITKNKANRLKSKLALRLAKALSK